LDPIEAEIHHIIVIPCYLEPQLFDTLESLLHCKQPKHPILVLIVINAAENAPENDKAFNMKTYQNTLAWIKKNPSSLIHFQCVLQQDLPRKHAGVGLARKIGMDAALQYFTNLEINGLITCLDADCTVHPDYLTSLEKVALNQTIGVATISFRHLFQQVSDENSKSGIIHYELFLRYYIMGLRYANYPFDLHTIGSSMACRALAYAKYSGMNRRKAGEDFYFLHKLIPHEKFVHVNQTFVYPSSRTSFRVPFGTGKAQQEWLAGNSKIASTYPPVIFKILKEFISGIENFFKGDKLPKFNPAITAFLEENHFDDEWKRMQLGSKTQKQFKAKFYQWFDGFKVLKMVHFLRDNYYPKVPILEAATALLKELNIKAIPENPEELLAIYREIDDNPPNRKA